MIGKVKFSVPYLGYPINYAQSKQGFILLIIIPAVVIIFWEIQKIINEVAKKFKSKKEKSKEDEDDEENGEE